MAMDLRNGLQSPGFGSTEELDEHVYGGAWRPMSEGERNHISLSPLFLSHLRFQSFSFLSFSLILLLRLLFVFVVDYNKNWTGF